jgi:hypothetical protein
MSSTAETTMAERGRPLARRGSRSRRSPGPRDRDGKPAWSQSGWTRSAPARRRSDRRRSIAANGLASTVSQAQHSGGTVNRACGPSSTWCYICPRRGRATGRARSPRDDIPDVQGTDIEESPVMTGVLRKSLPRRELVAGCRRVSSALRSRDDETAIEFFVQGVAEMEPHVRRLAASRDRGSTPRGSTVWRGRDEGVRNEPG